MIAHRRGSDVIRSENLGLARVCRAAVRTHGGKDERPAALGFHAVSNGFDDARDVGDAATARANGDVGAWRNRKLLHLLRDGLLDVGERFARELLAYFGELVIGHG